MVDVKSRISRDVNIMAYHRRLSGISDHLQVTKQKAAVQAASSEVCFIFQTE
jgi:hypothetical protein